tara:strand:- start:1094 stop:1303 length:210 start_codon:yes stop_codon:yes gene_type:complete
LKERNTDHSKELKVQNPFIQELPMTQITYRGVKYDAEQYKAKVLADAAATNRFNLMYRGIKVAKKVVEA